MVGSQATEWVGCGTAEWVGCGRRSGWGVVDGVGGVW